MKKIFMILALILFACSQVFAWTRTATFEGGTVGNVADTAGGCTSGVCYDDANNAVTVSTTQAHSGSRSAKIQFTAGNDASDTSGGIQFSANVTNGNNVWARMYLYIATPWDWTSSPVVKVMRLHVSNSGGTNVGWNSILGKTEGDIVFSNEPDGISAVPINAQYGTGVSFGTNAWHCYEIHIKAAATDGQGIFRIWRDGILVTEETSQTLLNSTDYLDSFLSCSYWNGNVPQNQVAYIDDIVITTDTPSARDASGNAMIGPTDWASGDTTPPTVTAFTIPSTASSLTVAITTFTATDAVGVTGYKLTESPTAPGAGDSGWTGTAPTSYTFSTEGAKTLYAWAKDAAGNVSTSLNDSVTITLDTTAPSVTISTADPSNISADTLSISGTASDAVGVTACKWRIGAAPDGSNGTALSGTTSWSGTATGFSSGANTLYAGCTDAAGNWGSDSMVVNYTPPSSFRVGPVGGILSGGTIQ